MTSPTRKTPLLLLLLLLSSVLALNAVPVMAVRQADAGTLLGWARAAGSSSGADKGGDDRQLATVVPATCSYYERPKKGCAKPRSCADCLAMPGCMISELGKCVNATLNYRPLKDFQRVLDSPSLFKSLMNDSRPVRLHFPSNGTTRYCPPTDRACRVCVKQALARVETPDSHFCLGGDGCLCIALCEASGWEAVAGGVRCGDADPPVLASKDGGLGGDKHPPRTGEDPTLSSSSSPWTHRTLWSIGCVPVVLIAVIVVLVIRNRRLKRQLADETTQSATRTNEDDTAAVADAGSGAPTQASPTAVGRRLNLSGWRSLRRQQIRKENLLLDGDSELDAIKSKPIDDESISHVALYTAPVLDAGPVAPSAPSFSLDLPVVDGEVIAPSAPELPGSDEDNDVDNCV